MIKESIQIEKIQLRKKILNISKSYTEEELICMSNKITNTLESTNIFKSSRSIFIYNSIQSEVMTVEFINKWCIEKDFYLPVVVNNNLVFRKYISKDVLHLSDYGILEPKGEDFIDYKTIDLIVIPGVAFDRNMNRMGRGKGYYDRFLSNLDTIPKIGICFDFQLFDHIPANDNDIKMDYIISEKGIISKKNRN